MARALTRAACVAGLLIFATPVSALTRGDVLVVDFANWRILRITPQGDVSPLVPTTTADLLMYPTGIGIGRDGEIVVADANGIVSIDPQSGDQTLVSGLFSGPPDLGAMPHDVAVNPREPAFGFFASLAVATYAELRQVTRNALSTTGSSIAPYPAPDFGSFSVVPFDTAPADPLAWLVATPDALLRCGGAPASCTEFWSPAFGEVVGLDALAIGQGLVLATVRAPCPNASNGLYGFYVGLSTDFEPFLAGTGDIACPGPVAIDPDDQTIYVVAQGANPMRVVAVHDGTPFAEVPLATLPPGKNGAAYAVDLAVWVPEPDAAALGVAAAAVLASFARRRRHRRASQHCSLSSRSRPCSAAAQQ